MAKFRMISPQIWNDAKFRALSDSGKLVFLMLLTHPHTSAIGTLREYFQGLAAELGWTDKAFREAFRESFQKGMVKADEKAGLIWLPNFIKYNPPLNPNVLKSWVGAFNDCPECNLKNEAFQNVKRLIESLSEAFREAFRESFRDPLPNQEQEQDTGLRNQDIKNLNTICAEQQSSSTQNESSLQPQENASPLFMELPLVDGSQHEVHESDIELWQELFPAADVRQEVRNMKAWLLSNPKKRKTKKGISRFISGWLERRQNNPGRASPANNQSDFAFTDKTSRIMEQNQQTAQRWLERQKLTKGAQYGSGTE